ncbi:DUF1679 domain-containing protein [Thiospirochaeta perfilievii]|uniref:DUF1679 domain-containing protein n=1 Tax=Thiospirochaeta perfilievii TaxID=252967 RepID=A0A5C1QCQ4_9SPIO|nr:oxidoreductase family protein [Thiospirochaeta perfilievii]QEN03972.1 DUF1679 domain-containing protein [Thiospirochaeta perfilievii]
MNDYFKKQILRVTRASSLGEKELIQNLWSNYGEILRYKLIDSEYSSIVLKHVKLPISSSLHPRGWNSANSHNRKIRSYEVECQWYKNWADKCSPDCRIPKCLNINEHDKEVLILLEDLNQSGYSVRKTDVDLDDIKLCITWLANFHGTFINTPPKGLWEKGTYWHLETRPDELEALKDTELKEAATLIDKKLENTRYKTILHGDAKLANFCFSNSNKDVAAVDFQYVGGGVGVKDLAYFVGSCLYEEDCEKYEKELLDHYFKSLKLKLIKENSIINFKELEREWRLLYPVAWTDFYRFLKGWSPGHWKINSYSQRVTRRVLEDL